MSRPKYIRIKTGSYFPKTVRAIGMVFFIFGLAMIWKSPTIGSLFLFIAAVTITTHYGFEINTGPNSFREYVWVLGWKDGKVAPFKAIEFLFVQGGTITFLTYGLREKSLPASEGYVKFEGRNEFHFLTDIDKDKLIARMRPISEFLSVDVKDYSDGKPQIVFSPTD